MSGRVIGLARRAVSRVPMEELKSGLLTIDQGLFGDCKGKKFPERQLTIMAIEDWRDALLELAGPAGSPDLPWTARRANVLVEGLRLPRGRGSMLKLRDSILRVTEQTTPCSRMEQAHTGLLSALSPNWRGGVTCKILTGGPIALGDTIEVLVEQAEHIARLPT